jgi:hypothetical protein
MATPIIVEGSTATNPTTGEKIVYRGGKWYPLNQDPASNPASGGKLTEDQGKAGGYARLMAGAENDYLNARADGYDPTSIGNAFAGFVEGIPGVDGLAPLIRNSREDRGRRAELQFSDAQLRAQSGAAAPAAEVRRNAAILFPGWGVNLQSADGDYSRARRDAFESARVRGGPAATGTTFPNQTPRPSAPLRNALSVGAASGVPAMGGLRAAAAPVASPAAPQARPATPAASLPPAARAALKEGQNVTFGNGQTWTLRNGQPVRLR